jgi:glycosyltransferase involved in cell wall biosynthesis
VHTITKTFPERVLGMKLSITIPCYNEIKTIGTVIDRIASLDMPIPYEIVIVDDYSKDGTRDFLHGLAGWRKYHNLPS